MRSALAVVAVLTAVGLSGCAMNQNCGCGGGGAELTSDDMIEHLRPQVAKWWLPDAVEFIDDIPHTATGKISKKDLRDRFHNYKLEG